MLKAHIILAVLWLSYCLLHSILASQVIKKKAEARLKAHYTYYRLYYSLFALTYLVIILFVLISMKSLFVFKRFIVTYIAGGFIGIIGIIIMFICIKKYFKQLSGIRSLYITEKTSNELIITGIHKYVRHPLYAGTFLFIWGLWLIYPLLSLFMTNLIITVYTIIGIKWEEQKLEAEFGESYNLYKKQVPKLIPKLYTKLFP